MAAQRSGSLSFSITIFMAVAAAALFQTTAHAATYVVGDAMGWTVPPANSDDSYEAWALGKNFTVGDVLVFNFTTGAQDVAQVTEQAADDCNGANPIRRATTGPANMSLTAAGMNYFICTIPGHCNNGQELKINVLAATGAPPTATTIPPPASPAPTTPPSSATTPPATTNGPTASSPSGGGGGAATPSSAPSMGAAAAVLTTFLAVIFKNNPFK